MSSINYQKVFLLDQSTNLCLQVSLIQCQLVLSSVGWLSPSYNRQGLSGAQAKHMMKKYSLHWCIPRAAMMSLDAITNQFFLYFPPFLSSQQHSYFESHLFVNSMVVWNRLLFLVMGSHWSEPAWPKMQGRASTWGTRACPRQTNVHTYVYRCVYAQSRALYA